MGPLVCLTTTRYGTPGRSESRSSPIGHIKLDTKQTGAPSAGKLHAGCDVAGAGNGSTATPKRARRGKPRTQAKEKPTGHRASPRPYGGGSGSAEIGGTVASLWISGEVYEPLRHGAPTAEAA